MESTLRIKPLVAALHERTSFIIGNPGHRALSSGSRYTIDVISVRDCRRRQRLTAVVTTAGELGFDLELGTVGECQVGVYAAGHSWQDEPLWKVSFFVVSEALSRLIPYRGDLHMHTTYSDGNDSPVLMAAAARAQGLDFAAITDHRNYEGSLEAIDQARQRGFDIMLIPGEEVNYCLGLGHVVSLNASRCVSDMFDRNSQNTERGVLENYENRDMLIDQVYSTVREKMDDIDLPEYTDRRLFGYLFGVVEKIHQSRGLAVVAHPFWSSHGTMDLIRSTLDAVLATQLADAVEVFGGMSVEENLLSSSYLQQSQTGATEIPLLGCSDAHSAFTGELGKIWTVVFAEGLSADAIVRAIKKGRTTPCIQIAEDHIVTAGEFTLVEYTRFLIREFFPRHNELTGQIGKEYIKSIDSEADCKKIEELRVELGQWYAESCAHFSDVHKHNGE